LKTLRHLSPARAAPSTIHLASLGDDTPSFAHGSCIPWSCDVDSNVSHVITSTHLSVLWSVECAFANLQLVKCSSVGDRSACFLHGGRTTGGGIFLAKLLCVHARQAPAQRFGAAIGLRSLCSLPISEKLVTDVGRSNAPSNPNGSILRLFASPGRLLTHVPVPSPQKRTRSFRAALLHWIQIPSP
jgi:hypothetical protein